MSIMSDLEEYGLEMEPDNHGADPELMPSKPVVVPFDGSPWITMVAPTRLSSVSESNTTPRISTPKAVNGTNNPMLHKSISNLFRILCSLETLNSKTLNTMEIRVQKYCIFLSCATKFKFFIKT